MTSVPSTATGEKVEPPRAPVRIPDKPPAWSPRNERAELEEKARKEGATLFRVEGYEELVARARKLPARYPDMPAPVQEAVDGMLAYDRRCREGEGRAPWPASGKAAFPMAARGECNLGARYRPHGLVPNGPGLLRRLSRSEGLSSAPPLARISHEG